MLVNGDRWYPRVYLLLLVGWCLMFGVGCGGSTGGLDPLDPDDPRPRVVLKAYPASGQAPLTVNLDGGGSWAVDKGKLVYDWDFDGDGVYDALNGGSTEKWTFSAVGTYTVRLRVTDSKGSVNTATTAVRVIQGNGGGGTEDAVTASLQAFPSQGAAPLPVGLDASGSWSAKQPLEYEYDYDGDGKYDVASSEDTFKHTYAKAGAYVAKVRVTNSVGRSATATVKVTVSAGGGGDGDDDDGDLTPVVSLSAYPVSGVAPHDAFLDASASWARSGQMVRFEYDVDGDGDYDVTTAASTIEHTYGAAGSYRPKVRGTDSGGRSATATGPTISVSSAPPNQAPTAILIAVPQVGQAPLRVRFDASASWDADGTITRYDWDFDGDGTFEVPNGGAKPAEREFPAGGNFTVSVRASDDDGATGDTSVVIYVSGWTVNRPPTARLSAAPLSGQAPLAVDFDATASTDPDNDALQFHFDFDGDGDVEDVQAGGTASYTYYTPGSYDARVVARDPGGLEGGATVRITVSGTPGNLPPVARLTATPTTGSAPLDVNFDARSSSDPDGGIERYLFDFDGNGTTDLDSLTGTASHRYDAAGAYAAKVTVRDTLGAQDSAVVMITVGGGGQQDSWPVAIVTANPVAGRPPLTVVFYAGLSTSAGSAIKTFDWDLDNDGGFELLNAGPEQSRSFAAEGTYYVTVRVTDYKGRQATGQSIVIVSNYM